MDHKVASRGSHSKLCGVPWGHVKEITGHILHTTCKSVGDAMCPSSGRAGKEGIGYVHVCERKMGKRSQGACTESWERKGLVVSCLYKSREVEALAQVSEVGRRVWYI